MEKDESVKLIGCCGAFCGLCHKYQSKAVSRCLGCHFGTQHEYCSIFRCGVKKYTYVTCSECKHVFRCQIFLKQKQTQDPSRIHSVINLGKIKEQGIESWLKDQKARQNLLEELLENFNEGRSMNFFCKACIRMPVETLSEVLNLARKKVQTSSIKKNDYHAKAKLMRNYLKKYALKVKIDLT